jgi:hypothetical protein
MSHKGFYVEKSSLINEDDINQKERNINKSHNDFALMNLNNDKN